MTTQIERYLDSIQATARGVEEHARNVRYYTRDCSILDAALKRGASGFVVLLDEAGEVAEVHPIGRNDPKVTIAKGRESNEWSLTYHPEWKRAAPTPMKTKKEEDEAARRGNASTLNPYEGMERRPTPTGDALRAKQTADAAKERQIRAENIKRNEAIFAQMKRESDKQWGRSA